MKIVHLKIMMLLLCIGPVASYADPIVFENAYEDKVSVEGPAWCSGCGTMWRVWDTFTLEDDTDVTQIDARLFLSGTQSIQYSIWTADLSGILFSRVVSVADLLVDSFGGLMESDVAVAISGLRLTAGEYALSIWDMAASGSYFAWYSTTYKYINPYVEDGSAYQSLYHDGDGRTGGGTGENMAFRVHGVAEVPEPATVALLLLGLAGMSLMRRRTANTG